MLLSPALQEYLGALEKAIHSMDEAYVELSMKKRSLQRNV